MASACFHACMTRMIGNTAILLAGATDHGWPDRCQHPLQCRFPRRHAAKTKSQTCAPRRLRLRGFSIQLSSALSLYVLGGCQSRSALPPSREPLLGPGLHNLLQPVERKDVFRAAGDQTPAPVQALLGRALPAIPFPPGFRPKIGPFYPVEIFPGTRESSG